jgi:hypothetical protein
MDIQGKIKLINDVQQITDSFKKREVVITTEEQYPQHILVEFIQDKTSILDNYKVGQNVKISINIRGREWVSPQGETKYFNTIQGWRIENLEQATPSADAIPPVPPIEAFEPTNDFNDEDPDDLPF